MKITVYRIDWRIDSIQYCTVQYVSCIRVRRTYSTCIVYLMECKGRKVMKWNELASAGMSCHDESLDESLNESMLPICRMRAGMKCKSAAVYLVLGNCTVLWRSYARRASLMQRYYIYCTSPARSTVILSHRRVLRTVRSMSSTYGVHPY